MTPRIIAFVGVGNLRCAPPVVAALATLAPTTVVQVHLCDANEERLDLMDRFARVCMSETGLDAVLKSTPDVSEAVAGATDVILALNEDGARRHYGQRQPLSPIEEHVPASLADLIRGDPNRPTPPDRLSQHTLAMLEPSAFTPAPAREELIRRYLDDALPRIPRTARLLSLMRGVLLPPGREHTAMNWPAPLPESALPLVPHQILRWAIGSEPVVGLLTEARRSPVVEWLEAGTKR